MKLRITIYLFALVALIYSANTFAQPASDEDHIKSTLTKLFDLSKADKYAVCADYIVYSGSDAKRKFTDTYKFNVRKEAKQVKRICKKIKALIDITDKFTFTKLSKTTKAGKEIYVQLVNFKSSGQQLTTKFEFVKVGGKFLLLSVK